MHERNKLIGELAEYDLQTSNLKSLLGGVGRVEDKFIVKATMNYIRRIGKLEELSINSS